MTVHSKNSFTSADMVAALRRVDEEKRAQERERERKSREATLAAAGGATVAATVEDDPFARALVAVKADALKRRLIEENLQANADARVIAEARGGDPWKLHRLAEMKLEAERYGLGIGDIQVAKWLSVSPATIARFAHVQGWFANGTLKMDDGRTLTKAEFKAEFGE